MLASRYYFCFLRTTAFRHSQLTQIRLTNFNKFSCMVKQQSSNFGFPILKKFSEIKVPYSSQKNSEIKSLTDQLLHAKIATEEPKESSKDEKSSEQKKKEDEFRKRAMKLTFIAFGTLFTGMIGFMIYDWGSPQLDEEGNEIQDEFSDMPKLKQYIMRTYREVMYYDKMIKEPSREKLLPEPLKEPYIQPPYTVVLEMTGVLVHPDWTYKTGWRFKKRPGVDYLLQQIGPPMFEVVIYTAEQGFTAFPIIDSLDPHGNIMYRLFRDATRYVNGHHVKDLSCLNRDLSKVIFIDCDSRSFELQPENALLLQKWLGEDEDRTLYDLANLLRTIATSEIDDVRTVLEYYSQFDSPIAVFKENQRKLKEEEEKRLQSKPGSSLVSVFTSGLRGLKT